MDRIDREDVLRILTPMWAAKLESAKNLRQRLRTVFDWALAHGYVEQNLAGDAIRGALPAQRSVKATTAQSPSSTW